MAARHVRLFFGVLSALIVLMVFPGCSPGEKPLPQEIQSKSSLRVFHRWPPGQNETGQLLINVFEEFSKKHTFIDLVVDSVPSSMYETQLNVMLASNTAPDIFCLWPGGRVEALVRNDKIRDLSRLWKDFGWQESFSSTVISGCTHSDGRKYILPIGYMPNTFWYNRQIFHELDLRVPTDWDELLQIAEVVKNAGYTPFSVGSRPSRWMPSFWFDYILIGTAGAGFRNDLLWGRESWTSPEVYRVFELWKSLLDKGYFNPDISIIDPWEAVVRLARNEAAMVILGPWAINNIMLGNPDFEPGIDFDFFNFPGIEPSRDPVIHGAIEGWCVNSETEVPALSAEFLAFFGSEPIAEWVTGKKFAVPHRQHTGYNIYDERVRPVMERLNGATSLYPMQQNYELTTLPQMQDAGMDGFIQFMENPENYRSICLSLEKESRQVFSGQ